jgi:aspartyl-tRNA(Asn)/glutamyl-tRNA(Gln) amidotransferase subunit C
MDVTREDVLRCARLAHLSLKEDEIEPMRQAMAQLLTQAQKLDELDLSQVEPFALATPLPRREDVVKPSLTQEEALANAPAKDKGCFVVPKVL